MSYSSEPTSPRSIIPWNYPGFPLIFNFEEIILFSEVIFLVLYASLREYLEELAPPYLAYDWDNSGPQVDLNQDSIDQVLIGLDPTLDLIEKGIDENADLLITHHPLIFSEINELDSKTLTGKKILTLSRNNMSLLSMHTPFDRSAQGLSRGLAERLELRSTRPLRSSNGPTLFRMIVFVPESKEKEVIDALTSAGAGRTDNYRESYYRSEVKGRFTPSQAAEPYRGERGKAESTEEVKLEFLVTPKYKQAVISALHQSHPYEEPGFSLERTEISDPNVGLGRIGKWKSKKDLTEIKTFVADAMDLAKDQISVHGRLANPVAWVATSPGAGGVAINPSISAGIELLITGELDYHERLEALERGLAVMEIGHFGSEKIFTPWLTNLLRERFSSKELKIYQYTEGKGS